MVFQFEMCLSCSPSIFQIDLPENQTELQPQIFKVLFLILKYLFAPKSREIQNVEWTHVVIWYGIINIFRPTLKIGGF